jgi:hypothetical protein
MWGRQTRRCECHCKRLTTPQRARYGRQIGQLIPAMILSLLIGQKWPYCKFLNPACPLRHTSIG